MRPLLLPLVALLAASTAAPPIHPAGRRIVGEWRGTSLCTNLKLAPACKDETVRYVFTGPIGGTNTYRLAADKLVGKEWQPMGDLDFTYGPADSTWTCALEAPRCKKCKWWFRIVGTGLVGGLLGDAGDTLRAAAATRPKP